eukprot:TRINITY_DN5656_c0_g1_i3.p1 TRINITY_DN5656_c0_g1~~TRINITY_DN5656_c0_g1_i3.p1  ORF type:complete len:147 (+),score=19.77 TRINITY_DN5656_c0_g1_i3:199-639(+)
MFRAILFAVVSIAALFLHGCGIDCGLSDKCTSPAEDGKTDCCVCRETVECMLCETGYYSKKTGISVDVGQVGSTNCGMADQYTCEKAEGDMTKCTSSDGKGGTDCIANSDGEADMTCQEGYSGKALGDWGVCGEKFRARYYTCVPN